MKTLIIALNSKYIHMSLAPWYLKACCGEECGEVKVLEFTINDSLDSVMASIYREKADYAAFSCYIWNIGHVLKLAGSLKKVQPGLGIILGGPEVSYDQEEILTENSLIDYIISGEGENTFPKLLICLNKSGQSLNLPESIEGLSLRTREGLRTNSQRSLIENLDSIPSPYTDEMLAAAGNRIIYLEASRGCPFSCTYCLSSTIDGVRLFSAERVRSDILKLIKTGIRQVKFVDRTFNCNKERAKQIFRLLIGLYDENHKPGEETVNFHFEAAADLFDEEMLKILEGAPTGLIQFEIGVQTVNKQTLQAINRKTLLEKVFSNVRRLRERGNIHLHLDLIAGLPYEDFDSFRISFDSVYALKPHQLQVGFLKLLKGSEIRKKAKVYGYSFRDYPPYEVLANDFIGYDELTVLKGMEELVDKYYNSGRFVRTLEYVTGVLFDSAFDFYHGFYSYIGEKGCMDVPLASRELYAVLSGYLESIGTEETRIGTVMELMKLDYLASDSSGYLPPVFSRLAYDGFKDRCFDFLKADGNLERYLPGFIGIPAKQVFKKVHFELLFIDAEGTVYNREAPSVFLFNYDSRDRVTGLFHYQIIEFS